MDDNSTTPLWSHGRLFLFHPKYHIWLVVSTPLKNMKVSWDFCSIYGKKCSKSPSRYFCLILLSYTNPLQYIPILSALLLVKSTITIYNYAGWWCNNYLEKYEFVNAKDDIPYTKWKIKTTFQTTNQIAIYNSIETVLHRSYSYLQLQLCLSYPPFR